MEIDNINDYFNIAKSAETVHLFHKLLRKMAFQPDDFNREDAAELLNIIDNERENLKLLAETFQKMGEPIELIPDENWDGLRQHALMYLLS